MKLTLILGLILLTIVGLLFACKGKHDQKSENEDFGEVLNDPLVNSKEVGEREGIKFFQVEQNGKMGFRDLDGKVIIEPKYDMAEMFSEGFSAVQVGKKWGLINESGNYVIEPKFEFLGSVHNGLSSFRENDKYGFVDTRGGEKIRPQFDWVDEFSEGFCVVRNGAGKYGYIDTSGMLRVECKFQYASKFENGKAKFQLNDLWGAIDNRGTVIEEPTHKYASDW